MFLYNGLVLECSDNFHFCLLLVSALHNFCFLFCGENHFSIDFKKILKAIFILKFELKIFENDSKVSLPSKKQPISPHSFNCFVAIQRLNCSKKNDFEFPGWHKFFLQKFCFCKKRLFSKLRRLILKKLCIHQLQVHMFNSLKYEHLNHSHIKIIF